MEGPQPPPSDQLLLLLLTYAEIQHYDRHIESNISESGQELEVNFFSRIWSYYYKRKFSQVYIFPLEKAVQLEPIDHEQNLNKTAS